MHLCAGRGAGKQIADHDAAVPGHEHVAQHQRLAAGAGEPQHLPVVENLSFGERHQQISDVPRVAQLAEKCAENAPLRIIAAAGERKLAREPPAAVDRPGGGARRQRRRGDRARIVAPHVDLRLLGILRDHPLMLGQHRIDPGRRGAAEGQLLGDAREQAEPSLQPAEPPRLQDAQDAGVVIVGDGLGRQVAPCRCRRRTLGEAGNQRACAFQQRALFCRQRAVIAGAENFAPAHHLFGRVCTSPSPSHRCATGPSLSPLSRGEGLYAGALPLPVITGRGLG